jgi:hypothetical protein
MAPGGQRRRRRQYSALGRRVTDGQNAAPVITIAAGHGRMSQRGNADTRMPPPPQD